MSDLTPGSPEAKRLENRKYMVYFNVALALSVIIFVEIILVQLPGASRLVFGVLLALLAVKFSMLLYWFMNLRWEKGLLLGLFLLGLFIALGTVAAVMAIMMMHPEMLPIYQAE